MFNFTYFPIEQMWIIDVQGPELGEDGSPIFFKSFLLDNGVTYKLGRASDCDIIIQLQKISRYQMEISVNNETDQLQLLNVGSSTFIYDESTEFKCKNKKLLKLNKDSSFRLRSLNWRFNVFKLPNIKISQYLKEQLDELLPLETDNTLNDDQVSINDEVKRVILPQAWIDQIKLKEWETKGKLSDYVIPETEKEIICLDDNNEEESGEKNGIILNENQMIDIKPMSSNSQFSLANRSSRRNRKSQLDMMFDEMDDVEDVETYTSQFTQKKELPKLSSVKELVEEPIVSVKESVKEPIESVPISIDDMKNDLSNLSLKRSLSTPIEQQDDNVPPIKKPKTKVKSQSVIETQPNNNSFVGSLKNPNGLVDVFKKTKQLKMDKLLNDEKMVNDLKYSNNNMVKIKKFHVKLQGNNGQSNPKIYSNYGMSYGSDPKWKNRLNYSKFHKISNGSNYNPIMDSTIKTIGFKNSNYKSDELQVNLNQNDDMIPDLDSMFPSEGINTVPSTTQRSRELTLFVESDYEDTQNNNISDSFDGAANFRKRETNTNTKTKTNKNSKFEARSASLSVGNSNSNSNNYNTNTTTSKRKISLNDDNYNRNNFNIGSDVDDDAPVFKSRRI